MINNFKQKIFTEIEKNLVHVAFTENLPTLSSSTNTSRILFVIKREENKHEGGKCH